MILIYGYKKGDEKSLKSIKEKHQNSSSKHITLHTENFDADYFETGRYKAKLVSDWIRHHDSLVIVNENTDFDNILPTVEEFIENIRFTNADTVMNQEILFFINTKRVFDFVNIAHELMESDPNKYSSFEETIIYLYQKK